MFLIIKLLMVQPFQAAVALGQERLSYKNVAGRTGANLRPRSRAATIAFVNAREDRP